MVQTLSLLDTVLLGLRSVPGEESATSAGGAVYGSDLVLPNQFQSSQDPPNQFYKNLGSSMSGFCQTPACHNTPAEVKLPKQVPDSLLSSTMVFVRKDGYVPPLAPLYEGPYRVLSYTHHSVCLSVCWFVCSIISYKPLDQFASNFDWRITGMFLAWFKNSKLISLNFFFSKFKGFKNNLKFQKNFLFLNINSKYRRSN